ncbi:MAG: hypothetical protein ACJ71I_07870 [Nitrososphaeraceae archaeon]
MKLKFFILNVCFNCSKGEGFELYADEEEGGGDLTFIEAREL